MLTSSYDDEKIIYEAKLRAARLNFWYYCKLTMPTFYSDEHEYQKEIADALQEFLEDDTDLLVINAPPRHGKTLTVGKAVEWYLGKNPKLKIMTASYNSTLSRTFSKTTRNVIMEEKLDEKVVYREIFPDTKLKRGSSAANMWSLEGSNVNSYIATAPNSSATGFGADILIIDDIIKNEYEAHNDDILDGHFTWFTDTMYSRLEGKFKTLLIMTRWSTKDLAGRLMELYKKNDQKFKLITKKAFENGKMLNERQLSYKRYKSILNVASPAIVNANYNQEPIDVKGRLYDNFIEYTEEDYYSIARDIVGIYAMADTADEGDDYLCNIIYAKTKRKKVYVLDVYYTKEPMEITEVEMARRLTEYEVSIAYIESNNGGRGFARAVEKELRYRGNIPTMIEWYHQTKQKKARILSNSTAVMKNIYMPKYWEQLYPEFHKDLMAYQREGKNKHDDAPDVLTAIAEDLIKNGIQGG